MHEKLDYIDMIRQIRRVTHAGAVVATIPYHVFFVMVNL